MSSKPKICQCKGISKGKHASCCSLAHLSSFCFHCSKQLLKLGRNWVRTIAAVSSSGHVDETWTCVTKLFVNREWPFRMQSLLQPTLLRAHTPFSSRQHARPNHFSRAITRDQYTPHRERFAARACNSSDSESGTAISQRSPVQRISTAAASLATAFALFQSPAQAEGTDFSQGSFSKESYYVTLGLFLLSVPGTSSCSSVGHCHKQLSSELLLFYPSSLR